MHLRNGKDYSAPERLLSRRTDRQRKHDNLALKMNKQWLPLRMSLDRHAPRRPSRRHRHIAIGRPPFACYQVAILQFMMHTPIFLNWIRKHDYCVASVQNFCIQCIMRALVEEYWGPSDPDTAITNRDAALDGFRRYIAGVDSVEFARGRYGCANSLYQSLLEEIHDNTTMLRRDQFKTIYHIDLETKFSCSNCGYQRKNEQSTRGCQLNVNEDFVSINEELENVWTAIPPGCNTECDKCKMKTLSMRTWIMSAPRVLVICIAMLTTTGKASHHYTFPRLLDLTSHQASIGGLDRNPLNYDLVGVVSHLGTGEATDESGKTVDGHYVATVQGQGKGQGSIYRIDDSGEGIVETFNAEEFVENPQRGEDDVVSLTYLMKEVMVRGKKAATY